MQFQIGMSKSAYAKRRGVTPKAVRTAIKSGRIQQAVLPDGSIDADLADRLWEANTDPTQRRGAQAERAAASMAAIKAAPQVPPQQNEDPDREDSAAGEAARPALAPRLQAVFEEDPPRRRRHDDDDEDDDDVNVIALAKHIAANKARTRSWTMPSCTALRATSAAALTASSWAGITWCST